MDITYTPEKIDEFITSAEKEKLAAIDIFKAIRSKIYDINIQNAIESPGELNSLLDKIKQTRSFLNTKAQKYYNVVEMYDVAYYPDNISKLDNLTTNLDNINDDLSLLEDTVDNIIEAVEKLKGQYFTK
jgi:uncharacterized coiled-coil DUF342 family protein